MTSNNVGFTFEMTPGECVQFDTMISYGWDARTIHNFVEDKREKRLETQPLNHFVPPTSVRTSIPVINTNEWPSACSVPESFTQNDEIPPLLSVATSITENLDDHESDLHTAISTRSSQSGHRSMELKTEISKEDIHQVYKEVFCLFKVVFWEVELDYGSMLCKCVMNQLNVSTNCSGSSHIQNHWAEWKNTVKAGIARMRSNKTQSMKDLFIHKWWTFLMESLKLNVV